jgi:hypothetical protein
MAARTTLLLCAGLLAMPAPAQAKKPRRLAMATVRRTAAPTALAPAAPEPSLAVPVDPTPAAPGLRFDTPPPPVEHKTRRWGLFAGGATLFVLGYGADIGLSYGLGLDHAALSLIPVFGPLAQMGTSYHVVAPAATGNPQIDVPANQRIDQVNHAVQTAAYVVLGFDCALQLAGTIMMIVGALPQRHARGERAPQLTGGRVALGGSGGASIRF